MAGRARDYFADQFPVLEPTTPPAVIFQTRCLFIRSGHEWNYKSDGECLFRKGEEVASERHRSRVPVDKDNHKRVFEFKKHLSEFLELKEQALHFGIGGSSLKLFRLPGRIVHGQMRELCYSNSGQWQLELPNLISDEGSSELNGKSERSISMNSF